MKNFIQYIAALVLSAGLTVSCDLDRYPESGIPENEALQTPDDAQQLVFGIYRG